MATQTQATQELVPVREVRDGIITLKDGTLVAILMASSLNFALKSEPEQEATLLQFQNFLNSLDFSIQFFIQSRKLDIRPYIALLEGRLGEQRDDLMKIQVREYIEFIKSFNESANIMTKNFFVVVPYQPAPLAPVTNTITSFFGKGEKKNAAQERSISFEESRSQLEQRVAVVEQGLIRTGVRTIQLGTEEAIELFYKMFNPGELERPIPFEKK